mmetsp:Transcript_49836/g.98477  ORF Transcript_49836/g.98477 Transcript_49836/m.98477 type:complete len:197 (+) Transcript_49836:171-761(+)
MTEEAPLNYALMSPVPLPKTLLLVNNFIVNTTKFLNRFSGECELKIADVSSKITSTQTALSVLEAKLRSVPGIEDFDPTTATAAAEPLSSPSPSSESAEGAGAVSTAAISELGGEREATSSTALVVAADAPPSNLRKASQHPRYRKFFKMLGMRIPVQACQQKMSAELPDEDTSILERPDELVELSPEEAEEEEGQ